MLSTQEKLNKIMRIKQNPNLAVLDFLENADSFTKNLAKKAIEEITQQLTDEFNEKISEMIKQLENSIPEISEQITEQIKNYTLSKPELFKGEDGKEYVLTEKDKKQIADSIKVPVVKQIVEKREIIREQPIEKITNEIKEVAKYEEPKQIVKKLNTLEEVIEQKTIKGLEEKFNNFKKVINNIQAAKGGGGGVGNPTHEVHNISAGTTSIVASYPIAANGNAIFCFTYQNARLEMTNHYTVGSDRKTITFNSDVVAQFIDNSTCAITYIRG